VASTVVYLAIDDTLADREQGEESELVIRGDRPEVGDTLTMGVEDRKWRVVRVEAYHSEKGRTVYIASITPSEAVSPDTWEPVFTRVDYPSLAFSVIESPELEPISYAWEMEGQQPEGRLMGYRFGENGQIEQVPLEWVIDEVRTCIPDEGAELFAVVNLCTCRKEAIAA
jgi:hypothetical protein